MRGTYDVRQRPQADFAELDEYEVRVYDAEHGRTLVAAIEIVSRANKDRPDSRDQFVNEVAALLREDVCVTVVDIVSLPSANLYADVLARLRRSDPRLSDPPPAFYAVTLRTRFAKRGSLLDVWF